MDNGQTNVPLVVWAAIGRGWGSGAQHSQAIHGMLLGRAGSEDRDAEHAVRRQGTAALGDHRQQPGVRVRASLADEEGRRGAGRLVPRADRQRVWSPSGQISRSSARRMRIELGMQAAALLAADGIDAEVVDLRTVKPIDEAIDLESVRKTGRVLAVDAAWAIGGAVRGESAAWSQRRASAI
jgi:pyruvate dehydrogenase E1 component beta subunit